MYKAVIHNETVQKGLKEVWKEMLDNATTYGRQEVGCYIYYNVKKGKYYMGITKYVRRTPNFPDDPIDLESPDPTLNGVTKDCILVASCHANTTLEHVTEVVLKRANGLSEWDRDHLNAGFGILLDYEGYYDFYEGKNIVASGSQATGKIILSIYNRKEVKYIECFYTDIV